MSPEPVPPLPLPYLGCDHGEPLAKRIKKGDKSFRAGEYKTAAELLRSVMAGVTQPERSLCLRLGDAMARAGRLPEALGAFRGAARLGALWSWLAAWCAPSAKAEGGCWQGSRAASPGRRAGSRQLWRPPSPATCSAARAASGCSTSQ